MQWCFVDHFHVTLFCHVPFLSYLLLLLLLYIWITKPVGWPSSPNFFSLIFGLEIMGLQKTFSLVIVWKKEPEIISIPIFFHLFYNSNLAHCAMVMLTISMLMVVSLAVKKEMVVQILMLRGKARFVKSTSFSVHWMDQGLTWRRKMFLVIPPPNVKEKKSEH